MDIRRGDEDGTLPLKAGLSQSLRVTGRQLFLRQSQGGGKGQRAWLFEHYLRSCGALPERSPEISGRRPLIKRIREILEYGLELIGVIVVLLILSLWWRSL
jgi:hypothetical protein